MEWQYFVKPGQLSPCTVDLQDLKILKKKKVFFFPQLWWYYISSEEQPQEQVIVSSLQHCLLGNSTGNPSNIGHEGLLGAYDQQTKKKNNNNKTQLFQNQA